MADSRKDIPRLPRVMIVDDHKGTVQMISHILKRTYTISAHTSPSQALEQLGKEPFDVLITDLKMEEMDGMQLLKAGRKILPDLMVIIITGHADKNVAVDSLKQGVYDFIEKPVEPRDLLRSIAAGWSNRRMEMVNRRLSSDLRKINAALKVSRASFLAIVSKSSEAIIVTDLQGVVRFVNPQAEQTFGRNRDSLVGRPFGFALTSDRSTQVEIVRPDRKRGVGEMRVTGTNWEGDAAFLVSIRDITERQQMEDKLTRRRNALVKTVKELKGANRKIVEQHKALIKEERTKALLQLAGATAHELNQPLMAMLGNIQLLKLKNNVPEDAGSHLDKIESAGTRMAEIVKRMQTIYHDEVCEYAGGSSIIDLNHGRSTDEAVSEKQNPEGVT